MVVILDASKRNKFLLLSVPPEIRLTAINRSRWCYEILRS